MGCASLIATPKITGLFAGGGVVMTKTSKKTA
jgi:hypothetical protein